MSTILLPTDFSKTAENAFIYALELAKHTQFSITVLNVYHLPKIRGRANLPRTLETAYEEMRKEAIQSFEENKPVYWQIAAQQNGSAIPLKFVLEEGETVETITKMAKSTEAAYIVMGTEGARGLKELFVGSYTAEVVEHANCPVLAVPEVAKFDGNLDKIAFTTSYKADEYLALEQVLKFAAFFNAKVYCINVDVAHTDFVINRMNKLKAAFQHHPNLQFEVLDGISMEETVANYLEENQMDVLAMLTHRRSFFIELFNYSQTKKMVYHSKTPVLAFQAHALGNQ